MKIIIALLLILSASPSKAADLVTFQSTKLLSIFAVGGQQNVLDLNALLTVDPHAQIPQLLLESFDVLQITYVDSYQLTYYKTASPVPEADTSAMLLAGLGLTGLMVRNKGRKP